MELRGSWGTIFLLIGYLIIPSSSEQIPEGLIEMLRIEGVLAKCIFEQPIKIRG